jgi:hypothetical protein
MVSYVLLKLRIPQTEPNQAQKPEKSLYEGFQSFGLAGCGVLLAVDRVLNAHWMPQAHQVVLWAADRNVAKAAAAACRGGRPRL